MHTLLILWNLQDLLSYLLYHMFKTCTLPLRQYDSLSNRLERVPLLRHLWFLAIFGAFLAHCLLGFSQTALPWLLLMDLCPHWLLQGYFRKEIALPLLCCVLHLCFYSEGCFRDRRMFNVFYAHWGFVWQGKKTGVCWSFRFSRILFDLVSVEPTLWPPR